MAVARYLSALSLALLVAPGHFFIIPGIAPHDYEAGERVWLKINSLTSPRTQVPYETYRYDFCKPRKIIDSKENFGEFLSGDRIQNSPYEVHALEDTFCNLLCAVKGRPHKVKQMQQLVKQGYHHNYLMDSLPAASVSDEENGGETSYSRGIPVGYVGPTGKFFIYNHVQFIVKYHQLESSARIVGLYAEPYSVRHKFAAGAGWDFAGSRNAKARNAKLGSSSLKTCTGYPMTITDATFAGPQQLAPDTQIVFTYDVVWEPSEVAWASRWDIYLATGESVSNVHWFSIVNALVVVVTLGMVLAIVLVRSLRADLQRYSADRAPLVGTGELDENDIDESGWKMVHADAFRPPAAPGVLCALVATGCQLHVAAFFVLGFAYVGFVSPANRGSLALALLASFALLGSVAGYVAARLYKALGGQKWAATTALTALLFPLPCGLVFAALDAALVAANSAGAAPAAVLAQLVGMGVFVAVPLVYLGAAYGFAQPALEFPTRPSKASAREVPKQPAALSFPFVASICGCVPFGAFFVELYFVLDSLWMESYYYLFGFLAAGFLLLLVAAAEMTTLLTYYSLCAENHHWWWRAFLAPATTGLYVFVYAAYYYTAHLEGGSTLSFCLYFGYMGLISLAVALVTGAAGFMASFRFVTYIFSQIKFD